MSFHVVRWSEVALPSGVTGLLAEAHAAGVGWMASFLPEWHRRPFLETAEGLFLAMNGDRPAAMAVISKDGLVEDPNAGRLRYIFVSQRDRRQGMAEMLVRAALAEADQRWHRVTLHTDNPAAAAIYLRYGFQADHATTRSTHVRLHPRLRN